jgi:hypothetical protein
MLLITFNKLIDKFFSFVINASVYFAFDKGEEISFLGQIIHARNELSHIWISEMQSIDSILDKSIFVCSRYKENLYFKHKNFDLPI